MYEDLKHARFRVGASTRNLSTSTNLRILPVCKITGRPRRPINHPGDREIHQGGPLDDQDFLSPKFFHDAFILFNINFHYNRV